MVKIIVPAITLLMTAGFMGYISFVVKKLTPVLAIVRK